MFREELVLNFGASIVHKGFFPDRRLAPLSLFPSRQPSSRRPPHGVRIQVVRSRENKQNEELVELLRDSSAGNIDFENLEIKPKKSEPDGKEIRKRPPLTEEHKLKIKLASKGKNKYVRTEQHRTKISLTMKKRWAERAAAGLTRKPYQCSYCGEVGHYRQTCPKAPESEKRKHKVPRSFEHRWKIASKNRKKTGKTVKKRRLIRCGYCKEVGHNRRTCPHLKAATKKKNPELTPGAVDGVGNGVEKKKSMITQIKISEVEDLKSLYIVPLDVESMWKLALDCAVIAWRSGVTRQRMEFTFPMLKDEYTEDTVFSSKGDLVRQFRVAALIIESVLKGLKSQPGLKGRLDVGVLDKSESAVYWEGKEMGALLFPQPQSLDVMISKSMMQKKKGPHLELMVNPQWQPGQVVSDFGFGPLKTLRENFVDSFEDIFYMKQISVFTDQVIVMRCYPSQWQVHLVEPTGKIQLIGTTREKPGYEKILRMLRTAEWSVSRLPWVERLRMRYIKGRRPSTLFPLYLTGDDFQDYINRADASIARRIQALNTNIPAQSMQEKAELPKRVKVERLEELQDVDIITGELARDIKLDPVKQFTSMIGMNDNKM